MPLSAIILAAGKSTRMKSDLPKPLHLVCGRPMLSYILQAAYDAGVEKAFVVVGHGKEQVIAAFGDDPRIEFVEQREQLGTGHAAKVCLPNVERLGVEGQNVIILAGDVPLIRGELLKTLVSEHQGNDADASMATAELADPFGYGRVIRDANGDFVKIVEQADGTPEQLAVREVFPSLYCVRAETLVDALGKITNNNAKGEYYLTDVFETVLKSSGKVLAARCVQSDDIVAPNTRAQLAQADAVMRGRILSSLMSDGVGVVDPSTTYVESGVEIGRDTRILPFSFVGAGAKIGGNCTVGPFAYVAPGAVVADGQNVVANVGSSSVATSAVIGR